MALVLGMFAFAPAGISGFTDSPHLDEGRAHFKEAAKTASSYRA
jgi:hypothetical protein